MYSYTPVQPRDPNSLLLQKPSGPTQKNIYFKCLIGLLDTAHVRQLVEEARFQEAQSEIAMKMVGHGTEKFVKAGLLPKLFLVCLYVTVTAIDKQFVEKARTLCLATLPQMFADSAFALQVQQMIGGNVAALVHFESKEFYKFVKQVFKAEEDFNLKHHFEKYFSMSGFLRDLLNEIIKLQGASEPALQPRLLLKVFDMIAYFFSQVNLRRSPRSEDDSFIFASLIDFKSFEFLSKLYKITEKLVDFDTENMTIMNMWFKLCEGREQNFEVLGKFLVHNLSSFVLRTEHREMQEQELEK